MRHWLLRLGLAAALLGLAAPAGAWWEYGHETVARIALDQVRPSTRIHIQRLLRQGALLETPTCPVRTIEQASVWADCIRSLEHRFSYSVPWHFVNAHVCRPFDAETPCPDGNCVTAQIDRNARLLANRNLPRRERLQALLFLIHFVGDLHQPLHASDRDDFGGNRFRAYYSRIRSNLHAIWDGYLAERSISTPPGEARGLLRELSSEQRAAMAQGSVADWARESWDVSRRFAYGGVLPDPCADQPARPPVLTQEQIRELIPIVRAQVTRGGLRLARLLDEALA